MLGKLMKYEWKATARLFVPFYAAVVIFALVNRVFIQFNAGEGFMAVVAGFAMFAYVFAIIATFALTLVIIVQRFYKNLLGDEGYLMFTLPVKTWQHTVSKMLIASAWTLLSVVAVFVSVIAMVANKAFWESVAKYISMYQSWDIFLNKDLLVVWFVVAVLTSLVSGILFIYASIAIGQLFSRHKLVASFGAFLALNVVSQIISSVLIGVLYLVNPQEFVGNVMPSESSIMIMLVGALLLNALFGIGCYLVTNHILDRRLNLE
ncbi:MAG: ABC transporter permease [Acetanaerobacterium sp.]